MPCRTTHALTFCLFHQDLRAFTHLKRIMAHIQMRSYVNLNIRVSKLKHLLSCGGRTKSAAKSIWRYINTGGILCSAWTKQHDVKGWLESYGKLSVNFKEVIQKLAFRSMSYILQYRQNSILKRVFINRIFWWERKMLIQYNI